jgi:cytochrome P450
MVPREAVRDTQLGGCPIYAGDRLLVMLGGANTDVESNAKAGEPEWTRKVNRHFGFGGGAHRCLGSHLARIELRTALQIWHERIPEYDLKPGAEIRFSAGVRTTQTFPMVLGPVKPRDVASSGLR